MNLFHLVTPAAWTAAVAAGEYRPPSLESQGFVHFSTAAQVEGTANLLYADVAELIVIEIDPERLGGLEVVVEQIGGANQPFPHVYGPIPVTAAVAQRPVTRDDHGRWVVDL